MDRWISRTIALVCLGIIFNSNSSVLGKSKAKSVTTLLDAKWKTTPLVLEVSEFLAEEQNEHFWKYIDRICDIDPDFLKDRTDKEYYDIVMREAAVMLSPSAVNLLQFYLSTRAYSPTVEMFHQIAVSQNLPEGCQTVIEINSAFTCDLKDLGELIETASNRSKSHTYKTDHHYGGFDSHAVVAILYGELATNSFREFHFILQSYAKQGKFDYIIRHFIPERPDKKVRLSGYGVELSIKSTEYKAQDDAKIKSEGSPDEVHMEDKRDEVEGFVFSKLKQIFPDRVAKLDAFRDHLTQSTNEMLPLKVWQLQDLGLQAAERIMASPVEEALRVMRDISQNFPLQARSLLKQVVRDELRKEIAKNQNMFVQNHNLAASDTSLFINGIYFDFDTTDIFAILKVIRQELRMMEELHRLGVDEEQMDKILQLDLGTLKQEYAIDMRDSAIQYINDIETDKKYMTWPSSISELLRPTYPGMLRSIRKNIFHLVFIVNPCDKSAKDLLKLAESFYVHRAPIRIGIMFSVGGDYAKNGYADCGVAMLNAFNFISQDKGEFYDALAFITDVYATIGEEQVQVENVVKFFRTKYHEEDTDMIFGDDSDYDTGRKLAHEFLTRTGLEGHPEVLLNGIRLDKKYLNGDMFEEAVLSEIIKQTHALQKAVYKGQLTDSQNVLDYLMQMPNVMPRVNSRILNDTWKLVDFTGTPLIDLSPAKFADLTTLDMAATVLSHMRYLTARDDNNFRPITNWIVADLETQEGRALFLAALEQMRLSDVRVGLVFNPSSQPTEKSHHLSKNVFAALQLLNKKQALAAIGKMLNQNTVNSLLQEEKSLRNFVDDIDESAFGKAVNSGREMLKIHQRFCKKVLNFQPGEMGIVSNGRILGPFNDGESFTPDDYSLLEKHSLSIYGDKMRDIFQGINSAGELDSISDLSMRVSSLILGTQPSTRVDLKYRSADYSVAKIPPKAQGQPVLDIKVIVNPLSKGAQKASAILAILHDVVNAKITVFLNSEDKLSDMPLKTFYRFVLEAEVQFAADDSYGPGPMARFNNMPTAPLLTLQMNTPENWLVEVMRTPFDLDNIRLEDVDSAVWSEFELEHLLVEGHCFDLVTGNPPRGLQFTLGTKHNPVMVDTIVMANLGYFQLKANPGAWSLRLRQGRSANIYDIISHDGTDSPANASDVHVVINDFRSTIIKLRVSKKPDKQNVDLLADEDEKQQGIWNSISKESLKSILESTKQVLERILSTFSGNGAANKVDDEDGTDDKINIFSLASGHLYERLLRIMMLSVVKHAKTPVKFWFLKNYLSPTLKDILPYMAKEYKFEYELVQYKWPRWLHQQTEKQRIIWGYKILFLDVLFPLSVKKIIFVDADQVVRADMTELRDLDLGGAPYGYTPFCDSRKEMDGYRFWKSGYWMSHLQGRKYHISALYVVDLKKFRRIAAGDRLRGQYQGLSQDPNSLSNLDQDLPNNMIHQVYIKSLPQEWLWCETWCDDASKAKAKTIDVCNNPQTKESKLSSATRIIPEWKDYDEEVRKLIEKYRLEKLNAATPPIAKDQKDRQPTTGTSHEEL